MAVNAPLNRKLHMGLIGGGQGAFIGRVHCTAAILDNRATLVAGAFYVQGWLRTRLETSGQKQADWRTDPRRSGAAGCFGDIGTHAYNLGRYITGLLPKQISCQLKTFEPGRQLDDYGTALIRYANGGLGTVTVSQVSHGREN